MHVVALIICWNRLSVSITNVDIIDDRVNECPLSELEVSIAVFGDGDSNGVGWVTLDFNV